MQDGEMSLLAAVCNSISHLYIRTDDEVHLEKGDFQFQPKMDAQCSQANTSYPSNPLYDESFRSYTQTCMMKCTWVGLA